MTENIRGEKVVYERKSKDNDVCRGCPYSPFSKSCLVWKYINPSICREVKKEIAEMPIKVHQSPDREEVAIIRVLSGWTSITAEGQYPMYYYSYYKLKSITDCNGYRVVSIRKSNEGAYLAYLKEQEKQQKKPPPTLDKYTPPHNIWI